MRKNHVSKDAFEMWLFLEGEGNGFGGHNAFVFLYLFYTPVHTQKMRNADKQNKYKITTTRDHHCSNPVTLQLIFFFLLF